MRINRAVAGNVEMAEAKNVDRRIDSIAASMTSVTDSHPITQTTVDRSGSEPKFIGGWF